MAAKIINAAICSMLFKCYQNQLLVTRFRLLVIGFKLQVPACCNLYLVTVIYYLPPGPPGRRLLVLIGARRLTPPPAGPAAGAFGSAAPRPPLRLRPPSA